MRLLLPVFACLMLVACGQQGLGLADACGLGARTVLPLEMRGNEPVVSVTINQRRARLVLDTGAEHTVINRSIAAVIGVRVVPGPGVASSAVGGSSLAGSGIVDQLQLGDQVLKSVPVQLLESGEVDGVLGLDILGRSDLEVNLPQRQAVLHRGSVCPGKLPPMGGPVLTIPGRRGVLRPDGSSIGRDPYLMVPVSLDGTKAFAMLDTGAAPGSLVSPDFARRAGAGGEQLANDPSVTIMGFGTKAAVHRHRFGQLLVGREVFNRPQLMVGGAMKLMLPVILGSDYFLAHRVWFNFAGDRVFVVPVAH